jgi:hypothetical protein
VETSGAMAELRKTVLPKDYPGIDFSKMKIYPVEGMRRLLPPWRNEHVSLFRNCPLKTGHSLYQYQIIQWAL